MDDVGIYNAIKVFYLEPAISIMFEKCCKTVYDISLSFSDP